MRKIVRTNSFKRDFKKSDNLESALVEALYLLANDKPLPDRYLDHELKGEWEDYRECHIKPDLLLVYQKLNNELVLYRLNSHSEIF